MILPCESGGHGLVLVPEGISETELCRRVRDREILLMCLTLGRRAEIIEHLPVTFKSTDPRLKVGSTCSVE